MTDGKLEMKKYYDREEDYTYDERTFVGRKSDERCAHCGKKIFPDYGLTIDHFIPLTKGGSNRFINLIPLCKNCNKEKGGKLLGMDYIVYMKDKYRKELQGYLDSYIQITDYVQRHRLLTFDEYKIEIPTPVQKSNSSHRGKTSLFVNANYILKLATWDDVPKLIEYYSKYLKKYDKYENEESSRENILFWMNFGCIYYLEKSSEITLMLAITIKKVKDDEDFYGITNLPMMYLFPYYATDMTYMLIRCLITYLPRCICKENNIPYIPITIGFIQEDKLKKQLQHFDQEFNFYEDDIDIFSFMNLLVDKVYDPNKHSVPYNHKNKEDLTDDQLAVVKFFEKFDQVTDDLIKYYKKYADRQSFSWMISCLMSAELAKETDLKDFIDFDDSYYIDE